MQAVNSRRSRQASYVDAAVVPTPCDLAAIYRDHHDMVWRYLGGLGVPPSAVDDGTQDVFVVVHRRIDDYDGRLPLRPWILGIARKVALKYREKMARRRTYLVPLDDLPPHACRVAEPEAESLMAQTEAAELVAQFLETMKLEKREVFVLVDIEGLTAVEVAAALDVNVNTVYSRLRDARQRFERFVARHHRSTRSL